MRILPVYASYVVLFTSMQFKLQASPRELLVSVIILHACPAMPRLHWQVLFCRSLLCRPHALPHHREIIR